MPTEIIIALISGVVAIIVAGISRTNLFLRRHASLLKDIELYNALPSDSVSKKRLLTLIDEKVLYYLKDSILHKRSPSDVIAGLIMLATGGYLTWFFIDLGSWWFLGLMISLIILMAGIYGTIRGLRKLERDEKGNPVVKKPH